MQSFLEIVIIKKMAMPNKNLENFHSRSSDSGKSSSCSPILIDFIHDNVANLDNNCKISNKRIQQFSYILLSLERKRDDFHTIRNRLSKITDKRKKDPDEYDNICNVCCLDINQKDDKTFVKCTLCKRNICRRSKCASLSPKSCNWKCELCKTSEESLVQTSSWVANQISLHQNKVDYPPKARSEIYIPISEYNDSSMRFESASQIFSNSTTVTDEQKFRIRQYVEEIVSEILDGNLDTIPISQLSKSENYLQTSKVAKKTTCATKYMSCGIDTPNLNDVSEERLRQLIQKIIAETINNHTVSETTLDTTTKIPLNNGCHQRHQTEKYFEPNAYQDLLATAVLNKIVDKQLNTKEDGKEFKHGTQSDESNFQRVDIRHGDKDLENNANIENLSTTSGSSVEPESDCSYTPMENIINANEEQSFELLHNMDSHMRVVSLPDLMAVPTESEDDYISVTSSAIGDGTWENNWLFKKKKHNSSGSATISSVGMLVPDPTDDIRAHIGDKTADEVSDLSELGSDTDDSLDILQSKLKPIGDRFVSKHLIGGATYKLRLDEIVEREQLYTDTINEHVFDAPTKNEAVNNNVYNQQKKEVQDNNYDIIEPKSIDPNSNSLEDQISRNSNLHGNKKTSTLKDYVDSVNNRQECLDHNLYNNAYIPATTTVTTSATTFTTVLSNENTNNLTITDINTNLSTTHNIANKSPNNLLTSAAQYKDVYASCSTSARELFNDCKYEHQTNLNKQIINDGDGDKENYDEDDDDNDELAILRHFLPGSIAEREYKKWYNAVEMPNNPYAPEALKRRISGSQERFIDLPNISPIKELNTLNLFKTNNSDSDDTQNRENDCKRYSRDYYINSNSTSSQSTPVKEFSPHKDIYENTKYMLSYKNDESNSDLYKAMPVQIKENNSLDVDSSQIIQPSDLDGIEATVTANDDSDTIKINDLNELETATEIEIEVDKIESKPYETSDEIESCMNISTSARGSTPIAFKFLQPKRKLLEPKQILSVDEDVKHVVTATHEKPVIEEEVAKALPSVKALARAFLMATNTTQPEKHWYKKAKTVSQSGKITSSTTKLFDPHNRLELKNVEEDVTITSDFSSLETDSSSMQGEAKITIDLQKPAKHASSGSNPHSERQGDFKSNIAFFENLKNK